MHQPCRNIHAPFHSSRELVDYTIGAIAQRNDTQHIVHAVPEFFTLEAIDAAKKAEIGPCAERGIKRNVLRHQPVHLLHDAGLFQDVVPTDPRIRGDLFVDLASAPADAKPGDIVVARITRYADRRDAMQGVITDVLGPEGAPGVDVETVIIEHGLATEFPTEVTEAAEALGQDIEGELARGRRDVRDVFTFTIDPADARDFDDAISIVREGGGFHLWVHIADVSHYVPWDSVVDVEARHRATSVYLVDRVLPMLPEHLSNVICSLNPGEDRLTFTVDMTLDKTGLVERYECYPSVMNSDRRLNYDEVQGWFDAGAGFLPGLAGRAFQRGFAVFHETGGQGP